MRFSSYLLKHYRGDFYASFLHHHHHHLLCCWLSVKHWKRNKNIGMNHTEKFFFFVCGILWVIDLCLEVKKGKIFVCTEVCFSGNLVIRSLIVGIILKLLNWGLLNEFLMRILITEIKNEWLKKKNFIPIWNESNWF